MPRFIDAWLNSELHVVLDESFDAFKVSLERLSVGNLESGERRGTVWNSSSMFFSPPPALCSCLTVTQSAFKYHHSSILVAVRKSVAVSFPRFQRLLSGKSQREREKGR